MKRKGFTLIELLVVIAIIAMLLAILMPALSKVKKIAQRVVCGTNLKGLGTAQTVYANDYEDQYAVQNASAWVNSTGQSDEPGGTPKPWPAPATVGASLYLLVREADVSPKSFVCGAGGQTTYEGQNSVAKDITEMWDFGMYMNPTPGGVDTGRGTHHGPRNHVSYSYQMPYGTNGGRSRHAADSTRGASFATMADKNPWYDPKLNTPFVLASWPDCVRHLAPHWLGGTDRATTLSANSYPHSREGQNVQFADGHSSFEKLPDVGVKHDNIYTISDPSTELGIRQGKADVANTQISLNLQPSIAADSFLVNDDDRGTVYPQ